MKYENISKGSFIDRPNRFIATVEIQEAGNARRECVHVKNTGRCRELLLPGAEVYLEKSLTGRRKTGYDLIGVKKGDVLVNIDSCAPNKAVYEWLKSGALLKDVTLIKPEAVFGDSRLDFYVEAAGRRIFLEVKGVTLEKQSVALFPDAPSKRAVKHVRELIRAMDEGYESYILFVIQQKGIRCFSPNQEAQPEFADILQTAQRAGVRILAYDCMVTQNSMELSDPVPVVLGEEKLPDDLLLERVVPLLLAWYDENRRVLPWREEPTPYRVWVSEIMLQQTRVEAVKPYFLRFMEELPDIAALAQAREDTFLKLWEGLGYYSRVRNLHAAAMQIMESYGGQMPDDYRELQKLKGIGSYTAGAIASIAFGRAVPAVDGNVLRVISRLLTDDGDIQDPLVKRKMEERLFPVMPKDRPGDFNQALMDLGATVCLANGMPKCRECPWEKLCRANLYNVWSQYPKKSGKKPRKIEQKTVLVIRDQDCVALRKRPAHGLLAGLYEFPTLDGHMTQEETLCFLKQQGVHAVRIEKLSDAKHIFTHKEWHMTGYCVWVDELEPMKKNKGFLFAKLQKIQEQYPVPSAFAVYSRYLEIRTGSEKIKDMKEGRDK